MDPRDIALQSTMPTIVVPLFGHFEPLSVPGNRVLIANDGMWFEARRPGIYSRQRIAQQSLVTMPYGSVEAVLNTEFSHLSSTILTFIQMARESLPNEVAMALIWDTASRTLLNHVLEPISANSEHITYKRPNLTEGQHVVGDIHSHGYAKAFFSSIDDQDDRGDIKIAIVVGRVDQPNPMVKARLCTLGHYLPLPISIPETDGGN